CNVFRLVGKEMEHARVFVINSKNLSTGIGIQVLRAAQMARTGMDAQTIVSAIEEARKKVRASFVIDTLVYLQRGGRCNAVTALLAGALRLKPQISVVNGEMGVARKFRGNIEAVIRKYAGELENDLKAADPQRVFITHSGAPDQIVNSVYEYLQSLEHFEEILITQAGSVISSHCGPNTLGILFYER
ncbi:MAG: DegV family protein, partial [Lachnospiraceae bacterium]|nr:DegV family protein [Lachnospiraceae bacterium]